MARTYVAATTGKGVWSLHAKQFRNVACLRYAVEFHKIARKTRFPIVQAFLLGQAIELYLKAFLFHRGYGETQLRARPFGHNLTRLLNEALSQGLVGLLRVSDEMKADLDALNKVYASKALQYFSIIYIIATPTLPKLTRLFRFAERLNNYLVGEIRAPA
jgi:HEPN domain-containing protein